MATTGTRFVSMVSLILFPFLAFSQIPNGGFENWTDGSLDGWFINNVAGMYTTVTASTASHSGTYALQGTAVTFFTTVMTPTIQSGSDGSGFAYSQRPAAFTGWYKFAPQGGDRFGVNVGLFKGGINGTGVGIAAIAPSVAVTSWTQFSAPFVYQTNDIPDTCIVQIMIVGPDVGNTTPHVGSTYYLDDIAFSGATSAPINPEVVPKTYELYQNYPNPFNPTTTIGYDLPSASMVTLKVYDILGREVTTLVNSVGPAGKHVVRFDGANLPSGFYFYKLQTPAFTSTRRMMLVK